MEKNTPSRMTTIRNTLISCRFPRINSNSPSSFFAKLAFQFFSSQMIESLAHRREYIDGQREHNRRVFFRADFDQRLQVAQLDGRGLLLDQRGRHAQLLSSHVLAFGVNNFRASLAFGFGLLADGA